MFGGPSESLGAAESKRRGVEVVENFAMSDVHLRPYAARDLDDVVNLWYHTWHVTFPDLQHPEPLPQWRRRFASELLPRGTIWVAEKTKRIIGFVVVFAAENYLDQIFVDPTCHGQGIGLLLLDKAKAICPNGLSLHTLKRNSQACVFYERHGFRAGEIDINPINGQPNIAYHWSPKL